MRTIPATFVDHARDGSEFFHLVEILPRGSDSWSAMRFGDYACAVDGNSFLGGYIRDIDAIKYAARIRERGGVATRDTVGFRLLNRIYGSDKLHRVIQQNNIEGRDVRIYLGMLPLNLVANSSFEKPTSGSNFDNWTETAGSGSNSITRQTSGAYDGAQYVQLNSVASPGPIIQSDPFMVRRGATVSLSFRAKASGAGQILRAKIIWDGKYWNNSTRQWQVSATHVNFTLTTSWVRYSVDGVYSATEPFTNADAKNMSVMFESFATSQTIGIDAVQLEPRMVSSSYHRDRYNMVAADLLPVYWGEVRDPDWDESIVSIGTRSVQNQRHKRVPIDKITNQWDASWKIPPSAVGKPFPMTYGAFLGDPDVEGTHRFKGSLMAGVVVNTEHVSGNPAIIAFDSPRAGIVHINAGRVYHQGENFYFPAILDDRVSPTYVDQEFDMQDSGPPRAEGNTAAGYLKSARMAISAYLLPKRILDQQGSLAPFTNPDNMIDGDGATYAEQLYTGATTGGIEAFVLMQQISFPSGGEIIRICPLVKCALQDTTGTLDVHVYLVRDAPAYQSNQVPILVATGSYNNVPWASGANRETGLAITRDANNKHLSFFESSGEGATLQFFGATGLTGSTGYLRIHETGLRLDFCIDLLDAKPCIPAVGRTRNGDTWGGRYGGDLIESPSEIVEGLARQELGIVTGSINTGAFDATHTARSTWKLAGQQVDFADSIDVVDDICQASGCLYYVDGAGKEAMAALDYGATARKLTPRDFVLGSLKIGYTPREDVVNDFILRYGYQPHLDDFRKSIYCNKDGQDIGDSAYATKCADSYAELGDVVYPEEFETRWITDDATAKKLMKWLVDWRRKRKRWVKATGFVDLLSLEHGDLLDLQLENYLLERDTDTSRPRFLPVQYSIKRGKVDIEFLEVMAP